ncbi:hypothetical protein SISNIDRAFT_483837 [Sistotremastrum niveocremeum HHB9708]|uniref:Uncharacterized protein n=1 Tax=Sistotremastrum niveocremeum HHB9708 TaxID=1314777 RepID=A0A164X3W7_9AGAM|nr:hypothetical protein SISNIDRAFT_483837 [Sistotremastrum niveocremeum HHB9708]
MPQELDNAKPKKSPRSKRNGSGDSGSKSGSGSTSSGKRAHDLSDHDSDNTTQDTAETSSKKKKKKLNWRTLISEMESDYRDSASGRFLPASKVKAPKKKIDAEVDDDFLVLREVVMSPVAANDTISQPTSLSAPAIEKLRLKHLALNKDGDEHLQLNKSFDSLQLATWFLSLFPHVEKYLRKRSKIENPSALDLITPALRRQTVVVSLPKHPEFTAKRYIQLSKNTRDGAFCLVYQTVETLPEALRDIWQENGPGLDLSSYTPRVDIDAILDDERPLSEILGKRKRRDSDELEGQTYMVTRSRLAKQARTSRSPSAGPSHSSSPTVVGSHPPSPLPELPVPEITEVVQQQPPPHDVIEIPDSPPVVHHKV